MAVTFTRTNPYKWLVLQAKSDPKLEKLLKEYHKAKTSLISKECEIQEAYKPLMFKTDVPWED